MRRIILMFIAVFMLSMISAIPTLNINYDFNKTEYIDNKIYSSSSIQLNVNTTPNETSCYYTSIAGVTPLNPFENNYGTMHEQTITLLPDGVHKYYIQCEDSSFPILQAIFKTNPLIYGEIELSEDSPLKAGTYEIILTTSKTPMEPPTLKYSFDGVSYLPVVLQGSQTNWKGYIIIEKDLEEAIGSFSFEAKDLSGIKGNELRGDSIFLVDTIKPSTIASIESLGDTGQIRLKWFYEEDFEKFNVYKSEDPNVGYINFYKNINKKEFIDNDVEKGRTYYYRIAAVDKAGNIGELSREVSATALFSNKNQSTGLRIELRGSVDNFLSEINFSLQNIDAIKSSISSKEQKEKDLFSLLKLDKGLDNSKSELNSLRRDVELYKAQDLTKEELENKISSARMKFSIIKKNIPENIVIKEEAQSSQTISEKDIQEAILLYKPLINEKDYEKGISLTNDMIKETELKITSVSYYVEVSYTDGTTKGFVAIEHEINSLLERRDDTFIILKIPTTIAEKTSEMSLKNLNYEEVSDNILAFYSDTKKISYYIEKEIDLETVKEVVITPIRIPVSQEETTPSITGNVSFGDFTQASYGIIIGFIFLILLGTYITYRIRNTDSEKIAPILKKIEEMKELKERDPQSVNLIYDSLKEDYKRLNQRQKEIIFNKIEELKKLT